MTRLLTMIPIFWRELVVASRREGVHSQRGYFAGLLLAIVLGTFAAWYYWESGQISNVSDDGRGRRNGRSS